MGVICMGGLADDLKDWRRQMDDAFERGVRGLLRSCAWPVGSGSTNN